MAEKDSILTQERLKELLHYDSETGKFTALVSRHRARAGREVGAISSSKYLVVGIDGHRYTLHRLAWLYVHGKFPDGCIDHINGNGRDNRMENLREATSAENSQNLKSPTKRNKSGFIGVHLDRRYWRAQITINGIVRKLGNFKTPEEAHEAYILAKRELHPFCTI